MVTSVVAVLVGLVVFVAVVVLTATLKDVAGHLREIKDNQGEILNLLVSKDAKDNRTMFDPDHMGANGTRGMWD